MKITVETAVKADVDKVWRAWNNPEGGKFSARMEAKDGSEGFDFEGTYTRVVPRKLIEYRMDDGRQVTVEFSEQPGRVLVRETFDAETQNAPEMQRQGWQAILDNFARHVEGARS